MAEPPRSPIPGPPAPPNTAAPGGGMWGHEQLVLTELTCDPLPTLSPEATAALEADMLGRNDRYLEVIEGYRFCPYARPGREQNRTRRVVYHAVTKSLVPLFELMAAYAADPTAEVIQVIVPRLDMDAEAWSLFAYGATNGGHAHMGGDPVFACAPLHPELPFNEETAYGLVPLFRRAPDHTIQWVRLDVLDAIYKNRGDEDRYLDSDPATILAFLASAESRPLYEQVCETNAKTVERLSLEAVVAMMAALTKR